MSYDRLAPGVQRWIDNHNWTEWTAIQDKAIPTILDGTGALIIAPTASGKTEAAILPIISHVASGKMRPIALLYISPLRALINDQTRRAQNLLEENGLRVGWWHSDLVAVRRKKLLAFPPHALFTTPESLEVMLSSDSYGQGALLGDVRFVLIDEIHAFAPEDRGAQMLSLLTRLESEKQTPFTRIALSATVSNPQDVVDWMRSSNPDAPVIPIIRDDSARGRRIGVGYFEEASDPANGQTEEEQRRLVQRILHHIEGHRTIIFVNSRDRAEALTFRLREAKVDAMVHHGSIHKEERQRVEETFRREGEKVIVATSTLELGIDIGDLDLVLQLGPPNTASSLLQRLGRSGRRRDAESVCLLYALSQDQIPIALAVGELALNGTVEDITPDAAALHVLFHQILNLLRERTRADEREIAEVLLKAGSFRQLTATEYGELIEEMIDAKYLERERDWLTIGSMTEKEFGALNYRDFYAVFESETEWTVRTDQEVIGTIDRRYPIARDRDNFLILGGRSWRVKAINEERLVLVVEPARRVTVPKWHSLGPGPSFDVMQKAFAIICGEHGALETPALTEKLKPERDDAKARGYMFGEIRIEAGPEETEVVTYFGSALNQYMSTLLLGSINPNSVRATSTSMYFRGSSPERAKTAIERLLIAPDTRREALESALPRLSEVRVCRFWNAFGPKTRRNVLRRFLRNVEPYFARIENMRVSLAGECGGAPPVA